MSTFRLVVISTALGCSIACGGSYSAPPASPSPSPAPGGPSTAVTIPTGAEVLRNRALAPDEVVIAPGTTVTWTNTDSVAHTSRSDSSGWSSECRDDRWFHDGFVSNPIRRLERSSGYPCRVGESG